MTLGLGIEFIQGLLVINKGSSGFGGEDHFGGLFIVGLLGESPLERLLNIVISLGIAIQSYLCISNGLLLSCILTNIEFLEGISFWQIVHVDFLLQHAIFQFWKVGFRVFIKKKCNILSVFFWGVVIVCCKHTLRGVIEGRSNVRIQVRGMCEIRILLGLRQFVNM